MRRQAHCDPETSLKREVPFTKGMHLNQHETTAAVSAMLASACSRKNPRVEAMARFGSRHTVNSMPGPRIQAVLHLAGVIPGLA